MNSLFRRLSLWLQSLFNSCRSPLIGWLMMALASGFSAGVVAEAIPNLYRVTVPVASQSPQELQRASREGLAELFVRVSGHSGALNQPGIVAAVKNAKNYTKQFSYQTVAVNPHGAGQTGVQQAGGHPNGVNQGAVNQGGVNQGSDNRSGEAVGEQLQVVLEYERLLVDNTLRREGLALWSNNRPTVLVWLAVEDQDGRRFAGPVNYPEIVTAMTASAKRRGLPIKLPILDLQDMIALDPDDIWRQDSARLHAATERYSADTQLVGRVTHLNNGQWIGRWSYEFNGIDLRFDSQAEDIDRYIAAALNRVADALATQYAVAPVTIAEGGILLRLTDVRNFIDYARAISYLESLGAVHHANVVSVDGEELIVRLIADGQLSQLQQAFGLDKRLLPQTANYSGEYPIVLDYRWPSTAASSPALLAPAESTEAVPPQALDASQLPDMEAIEP